MENGLGMNLLICFNISTKLGEASNHPPSAFHEIEPPLSVKNLYSKRPVIIPYHKGGRRLHIGFSGVSLKSLAARSQAIIKSSKRCEGNKLHKISQGSCDTTRPTQVTALMRPEQIRVNRQLCKNRREKATKGRTTLLTSSCGATTKHTQLKVGGRMEVKPFLLILLASFSVARVKKKRAANLGETLKWYPSNSSVLMTKSFIWRLQHLHQLFMDLIYFEAAEFGREFLEETSFKKNKNNLNRIFYPDHDTIDKLEGNNIDDLASVDSLNSFPKLIFLPQNTSLHNKDEAR
ncbi:hypothetical protein NC651_040138 [Populus alba x Populus x berolinensis]|nr:hypothetical protein NC651_040138 [Populus alba x Populus x berolinensis]